MAYPTYINHHVETIRVEIPEIFVVSFLANANGEAVTGDTMANAIFIKTELYDDADEAWSRWDALCEANAAFASCQNQRGESIV